MGMALENDKQQEEVDRNYKVFREKLPSLLGTYDGKYALMHEGEIVEFLDSAGDAFKLGRRLYLNGLFSIQKVTWAPENLGYFSYV